MTNPTPLPALPDAFALFVGVHDNGPEMFGELYGDPKGAKKHLYSAEQMREYAESAIAALGSSMPSGEAVAEVCSDYELRWAGGDAIFNIVRRTGVKVGSKLYATHPTAAVQGGLTEDDADVFGQVYEAFEAFHKRRGSNKDARAMKRPMTQGSLIDGLGCVFELFEQYEDFWLHWKDAPGVQQHVRAALSANAGSQQSVPVRDVLAVARECGALVTEPVNPGAAIVFRPAELDAFAAKLAFEWLAMRATPKEAGSQPTAAGAVPTEVERDAARYRWLCDVCPDFERMAVHANYGELDSVIDVALAAPADGKGAKL